MNPTPQIPRSRSTTRGDQTRARLLNAALETFAAKSFHGTGTRDIAEAAGVSQAAMYIHYPTKEDLLLQLCLDGYRELEDIVCAAESRGSNPGERLGEWVHEFVVWHVNNQVRARVIHYEVEALSSEKLDAVKVSGQQLLTRLRRIIADGAEWGKFQVPDAYLTAAAIMSMGIDVARWYKMGGNWGPEEVGERYRYLSLRMVGYIPTAPPRP